MIEIDNVYKSFTEGAERHAVLSGVALQAERGEAIALFGRSGSGKSTLLNLVAGIETVDRGSIRVLGHSLEAMDDDALTLLRRHHLGFVFQFFNLLPSISVLDNLMLPQSLLGVGSRSARERAQALLRQVGLANRATSYPDQLSGGEQQRVALARAVAHEPDLVLADEPTGNLDGETAEDVLAMLSELTVARERVLLMATHAQSSARICSRTIRLHNGQVQEFEERSSMDGRPVNDSRAAVHKFV
jgi:putative ABC transport system ATP-binding protein